MSDKRNSYKEIAEKSNPDDIQPINCLINASLKNIGGRPVGYSNNEYGLNCFIQNSLAYFEYVSNANAQIEEPKKQLILDVDSWALWLGITRKTICEYQKRSEIWDRTISLYKNAIGSSKKQLALHGLIPSVMAVFDLANNHGYINTNEFKLVQEEEKAEKPLTLEEKIAQAGLVWNEETKSWD